MSKIKKHVINFYERAGVTNYNGKFQLCVASTNKKSVRLLKEFDTMEDLSNYVAGTGREGCERWAVGYFESLMSKNKKN
jgi:hypothetical protein